MLSLKTRQIFGLGGSLLQQDLEPCILCDREQSRVLRAFSLCAPERSGTVLLVVQYHYTPLCLLATLALNCVQRNRDLGMVSGPALKLLAIYPYRTITVLLQASVSPSLAMGNFTRYSDFLSVVWVLTGVPSQ